MEILVNIDIEGTKHKNIRFYDMRGQAIGHSVSLIKDRHAHDQNDFFSSNLRSVTYDCELDLPENQFSKSNQKTDKIITKILTKLHLQIENQIKDLISEQKIQQSEIKNRLRLDCFSSDLNITYVLFLDNQVIRSYEIEYPKLRRYNGTTMPDTV